MEKNVKNDLKRTLLAAKNSMKRLPDNSYIVVDYDEFKADPRDSIDRVQRLIGIEWEASPDNIRSQTRRTTWLDATRRYADEVNACSI